MILETDLAPVVEESNGIVSLNFAYCRESRWYWLWRDSDEAPDHREAHWTEIHVLLEHVDRLWAGHAITDASALYAREMLFQTQELLLKKQRGSLWNFILCLIGR